MIRTLYSWALWAAQPLLQRKLRRRAEAEPSYGQYVGERFGYYDDARVPSATDYVWIHAVSLGETRAAAVLLEQLRTQFPDMRLLLTHSTATGRNQGRALLREGDVQVWLPWDMPDAVERFLRRFEPRLGILIETEVWPNLAAACQASHIPLCLVNARMSEKSLRRSLRLAWLARPAYRSLAAVWAQSQDDAWRLHQLGAPVQGVLGNFKYDATPNAAQLARGRVWRSQGRKPVVLLASSREGEERMWLDALLKKWPLAHAKSAQAAIDLVANSVGSDAAHITSLRDVQWMVVPRHPQRFEEVYALLRQAGLSVSCRSAWADAPEPADVWLGDSVGDMALYYGMADVALLGGSFAPFGGQNLIEAAACACPVVMGPHTFNFAQAAQWARESGAAWECPDMALAIQHALEVALNPTALSAAQEAAVHCSQQHRGAAARTARALAKLLAS